MITLPFLWSSGREETQVLRDVAPVKENHSWVAIRPMCALSFGFRVIQRRTAPGTKADQDDRCSRNGARGPLGAISAPLNKSLEPVQCSNAERSKVFAK